MAPARIKIARCGKTKTVVPYDLENPGLGDVTFDESRWTVRISLCSRENLVANLAKIFQREICKKVDVDPQVYQLTLHRPGSCGLDLDRRAFNRELSDGPEFFQYHITLRQPSGQGHGATQGQARDVPQHHDQEEEQKEGEADDEAQEEEDEFTELDEPAEDDVRRPTTVTEQSSEDEESDNEHDGDEEVSETGNIEHRAAVRSTRSGKTDPKDAPDHNSDDSSESESNIREIRNIGTTRIQTPNFRGKLKTDIERQPQPHAVIRIGKGDDLRLDAVDGEDGVPMEVIIVAVVW